MFSFSTHCFLKRDPSFADVKLIQTKMFLEKLSELHQQHRAPLIIAGDFNSTPDSGVFDLLTKVGLFVLFNVVKLLICCAFVFLKKKGRLGPEHKELKSHSYYGAYSERGMSHDLSLVSCYPPAAAPYTNCTHDFRGVLDYIFVSTDAFRIASVLGVVPLDQLPLPALPNAHYSSDHVSLFASIFLR